MSMLLSLALLTPTTMAAGDSPARPPMGMKLDPYNLELRDYNFPSGLRIIFQEDHTQPLVSITAVIDRGSSHDPVGKEGIAHLVEHMWFQSKHGDLPKVWDILEELGANLNASTASDWTNYMTVVPKEAFIPVLRLEALRMEDAVREVSESDLVEEREVVRNELRMRYENSSSTFLQYLYDKMYPDGHPYSRLGIGTHDSLNNIQLADVQAFVDKNYVPENTTIVVVGDFYLDGTDPETGNTIDNGWQFIQQAFPRELLVDPENPDAPIELQEPPVRVGGTPQEPPDPQPWELEYHKGGTEKPTLFVAWTLPGGYTPDSVTAGMAVQQLNYAIATYLAEGFDIRSDDISDYESFGCFYWEQEVNSAAVCSVEMNDVEDAEDKLEKTLDGLYKMWEISDTDLVRQYQNMLFQQSLNGQMASVFSSVEYVSSIGSGRATDTANFTHFTGDPVYYSRAFEWINQADRQEVTDFAKKYLNRDRAVAVVIEPYGDDDISIDSSDAIYKGATRREQTMSMMDLSEVDSKMLETMMSPPDVSAIKTFTLDNGLDVVMMPYGEFPFIQVATYFEGGDWYEPKPGLDEYTHDWLDSDYRSARNLAGAWFDGGGGTYRYMGIQGSSGNTDALLWMLRERLDTLNVSVDDRNSYLISQKKAVRYERKFPDTWASAEATSRLLEGHPAGFVKDESFYEGMKDISLSEMQAWFRRIYRPENGTLYVVGRMDDPDLVEKAIRDNFGGWEQKGQAQAWPALPAVPPVPERQVIVFDKQRVTQTNVTLFCQTEEGTLENYESREMLAQLMDRSAWVSLREQAGVTYGAGSAFNEFRGGTSLLYFYSLVQNNAAGLAVRTFLDMSDAAAKGDLDGDRLQVNKVGTARKYVLGHQTTRQMLGRVASAQVTGHGMEFITDKASRLGKVDLESVSAMAQRCNGHEIVTLVGPKEVITPQLDEEGIPYEVFDWESESEKVFATADPKAYKKWKKKKDKAAAKAAKKGESPEDGLVGSDPYGECLD